MLNTVSKIFSELEADKDMLTNKNNTLERIVLVSKNITFFLYYSPSTSKRGLRVSIPSVEAKMKFKVDSNGFTYRYHEESLYIEEDKEYITNIFKVFISELIPKNEIGNSKLFFDNFKNTILEWRDFFQEVKQVQPSQELVKGLFGELSYLIHLLRSGVSNAVDCWTGPLGSRSDFFLDNKRLEIKSTTTSNPVKISVSSANQLNLGSSELNLILYELVENEGGNNIGDKVKEVVRILDIDFISKANFYKKMERIGCNENYISLAKNYTFKISDLSRYIVNENFPTLSRNNIPQGIIDVNYSILKDNIKYFKIDLD
ncbi:PD-(D/E)XK motif protein [Vibrio rotiferianus]|uniref:PD-(D/E)XK motif protein n=1 Tax=Vibrio rotiferianus TaxID=190895 RepID=UPI0038B26514